MNITWKLVSIFSLFRFDADDLELQDEPLQVRIMDYDTYTANDAIGKVKVFLSYLAASPLQNYNGFQLSKLAALMGIRASDIKFLNKQDNFFTKHSLDLKLQHRYH